MRAGLNTILQTLTPDAASVLNRSMAEAGRRSHGQTTPLHVAATLLAAPSGLLRQACIRSHPTSSHPLQCRALELCFSVALDRLPTTAAAAAGAAVPEPPISNALMAALKRAQAHQRRGCPEQQQQPLLAVKVELEQLVISILDDPSVSRVMREASFSSPDVKSTIEQSLSSSSSPSPSPASSAAVGLGLGVTHRPPTLRRLSVPARSSSIPFPRPLVRRWRRWVSFWVSSGAECGSSVLCSRLYRSVFPRRGKRLSLIFGGICFSAQEGKRARERKCFSPLND